MGIEVIHRKGCPKRSNAEARCHCRPGYRALVYDRRVNRRVKSKVRKTLKEARDDRTVLLNALRGGTLARPSSVSFARAADELIEAMTNGSVRTTTGGVYKPSTIRGYRQTLRTYTVPAMGSQKLGEIDRFMLQRLITQFLEQGLSGGTIQNLFVPVRVIFRNALDHGVVPTDPTGGLRMPAKNAPEIDIVSREEIELRLSLLSGPLQILWAIAFYAGLRRGELLGLTINALDFERRLVRVIQNWDPESQELVNPKSKAGKRAIPMVEPLEHILRNYLKGHPRPNGFLVEHSPGKPYRYADLREASDEAWARGGVRRITLHTARHTFISLMIAAGLNAKAIQIYAGHADIGFTFQRYGHLFPGHAAESRCLLNRLLADDDGDRSS